MPSDFYGSPYSGLSRGFAGGQAFNSTKKKPQHLLGPCISLANGHPPEGDDFGIFVEVFDGGFHGF